MLLFGWQRLVGDEDVYGRSEGRLCIFQIYLQFNCCSGIKKMDNTVKYLGVELEDALAIPEAVEI